MCAHLLSPPSSHKTSLDSVTSLKYSGCKSLLIYNKHLQNISHILGLRNAVSLKELCVQYGCLHIHELAQRAFQLYVDRFIEALPPQRRDGVDFSTKPIYVAMAFYLAAKKMKVGDISLVFELDEITEQPLIRVLFVSL